MNYNLITNMYEFIDYLTQTPVKDVITHFIICSVVAFLVGAFVAIEIFNRDRSLFLPKCFRRYMIDNNGGVIVSKSDNGIYDLVSGNLILFLREEANLKDWSDSEIIKLIIKYCKYVDKFYGKDSSFVAMNIGKDYKSLVDGSLI